MMRACARACRYRSHACAGTNTSGKDGGEQRAYGTVEDMQHVVTQTPSPVRRCCPATELRERGPGAPDVAVQAAVGAADEPGPGLGGGGAGSTRRGGEHREPADPAAGLRATLRRGALRRASVEGHRRGPDPDREPHRGGVRGADPHGEGAAGRGGGLHLDRQAAAGEGAGPGRGHRAGEDRVLPQGPHAVLEETPVRAQEDHHPATDGVEDQQHRAGPQTDMMKMKAGLFLTQTAGLFVLIDYQYVNKHVRTESGGFTPVNKQHAAQT